MKIKATVFQAGCGLAPEDWKVGGIPRPYRLYYVNGGSAYFRMGKREEKLKKGYFYLFPSSLPFLIRQDTDDRLDHLYFDFIMSPPVVSKEPLSFEAKSDFLTESFVPLLKGAVKSYACSDNTDKKEILTALLESFLTVFLSKVTVNENCGEDILKTVEYIERHYDENISIKEIAKSIYLSEDYFIRKFKKVMGMTPYAYLSGLRLSVATSLMEENLSLTEAAAKVGYQHPSSLCHALKRK